MTLFTSGRTSLLLVLEDDDLLAFALFFYLAGNFSTLYIWSTKSQTIVSSATTLSKT